MLHDVGQRLGVRVIAVDRPGFGGSPFTPTHNMHSWAQSMQRLADQLHLGKFSILGASGGAPFAAACARYIPSDRIMALGLLCPLGPVTHTRGMSVVNKLLLRAAWYWPGLCRFIWKQSARWMQYDPQCMSRFALTQVDKEAMMQAPLIAEAIREAILEGLRAGAQGVVHEMILAQRDWGFHLEEIKVPHAFVWHGLKDPVVPLAMARMYEQIPGCKPTYFDDDTHTTIIIKRFSTALEALCTQHQNPNAASSVAATVSSCLQQQQLLPPPAGAALPFSLTPHTSVAGSQQLLGLTTSPSAVHPQQLAYASQWHAGLVGSTAPTPLQ